MISKGTKLIHIPYFAGQDKYGVHLGLSYLKKMNFLESLDVEIVDCPLSDDQVDGIRIAYDFFKHMERDFVLTLGGDHTIAIPSVCNLTRSYKNPVIIWFDAHADINNHKTTITGNLHGMPMHAILWGEKTFVDPRWDFVKDRAQIKPDNVLYIGLRDVDPGEIEIINRYGLECLSSRDFHLFGEAYIENYLKIRNWPDVHLSFDLDGLDCGEFSATGYHCKDGIRYVHAHNLIKMLRDHCNLKSMDLVEFNPLLDITGEDVFKVSELIRAALEGR